MISLQVRVLVFLGIFGLSVTACFLFSESETNPVAGVVAWLPDELEGKLVYKGEMGELEKRWLPGDTTYVKRVYIDKYLLEKEAIQKALHATLIIAGSDSRSLHRPEVCLRGQQWTITNRKVVPIETSGGRLEVMDFYLERFLTGDDNRPLLDERGQPIKLLAHYIYWWVGPDTSTASDEERVWLEVWNSILKGRKERWAYPSVQVVVDTHYGRKEAQERAYSFIKEYAPQFQKSLGAKDREGAVPLKISGS